MNDIQVRIDGRPAIDLAAVNRADVLTRAVVVSLFTWRRADASDVHEGQRMGWWGDATGLPGDRIGSRLWLLAREKLTTQTINRAREYAREALAWIVDDSLARRVEVLAERQSPDGLALQITVYRDDGQVQNLRFDNLWEGIRNAV